MTYTPDYTQYCWYRLPCGICTGTNMQCPLTCGTVEVIWTTDATTTVAERKDKYVTLHHDDIHFVNKDAEKAFYESLAERKEE